MYKVVFIVQNIKVTCERNHAVTVTDKPLTIRPTFGRQIIRIDENKYNILIDVCISKDNDGNDLPFTVQACVGGIFALNGISEEECNAALGVNASAILFPYLRTTVSTVMALAEMPPLIFPVMNVDKMFDENK